jgi:Transglutaminase-like superfamily
VSTLAALPKKPGGVSIGRWVICWGITVAARGLATLPPRWTRSVLDIVSARARPASYVEAKTARDTVTTVSLRCAGPGCLPRSIATTLLCRLGGAWPTWRVGVRTAPFSAHAWVEAEGRPVDEPPGTERFHVLMTVEPTPPRTVNRRSSGARGLHRAIHRPRPGQNRGPIGH